MHLVALHLKKEDFYGPTFLPTVTKAPTIFELNILIFFVGISSATSISLREELEKWKKLMSF